jgi:hypothetical protein
LLSGTTLATATLLSQLQPWPQQPCSRTRHPVPDGVACKEIEISSQVIEPLLKLHSLRFYFILFLFIYLFSSLFLFCFFPFLCNKIKLIIILIIKIKITIIIKIIVIIV